MTFSADRLYQLLPAFHRVRDAENGRTLEALIAVLAEPVAALEEDLAQLYDDQFVETCADWAVPYLADLIGYRPLRGTAAAIRAPRAEVADTIGYRRRKGTAAMLEQLARDVSGWNARVVEFFRLIAWTQHLQHLRPEAAAFASLRSAAALELIGGAFDPFAHTVGVRRISSGRGRHNIPDIGIFLWRLEAFGLTDIPATPVDAEPSKRFRFNPLGADTQLVNRPEPEIEVTHLAEQVNVPSPLTRRELGAHLTDYWDRALAISDADGPIPATSVQVCHLGDQPAPADPGTWAHPPTSGVAVDPVLGRIAFAQPQPAGSVRVTYHYPFSSAIGGGEYDRLASFGGAPATVRVPADAADIAAAVIALGGADGVIEVKSSDPQSLGALTLAAGQQLELRAADGFRPLLTLDGDARITGGPDAGLTLNGFLVVGGGLLMVGRLRRLIIRHCTLLPGRAITPAGDPVQPDAYSVRLDPDPAAMQVTLELDKSISGPLRAPERAELLVSGSIVDAGGAGERAVRTRAFVSGDLAEFPALAGAGPLLQVTIGNDGPHPLRPAAAELTDLPAAAAAMQAALRATGPGPAFAEAAVALADHHLILLAGTGERVAIDAGEDPAAALLKLDAAGGRPGDALLGARVADPPTLRAAAPKLVVRIGDLTAAVTLTPSPSSLAALATELQERLRAARPDPTFTAALVGAVGHRLLIVAGAANAPVTVAPADADPSTIIDLGLGLRPSIGGGSAGADPGPAATVIRSTVVGPVFVREILLSDESLFVDPVWAMRRQVGCARFSYLPPGSQTPRRYRCQPADVREANRIRPSFTTLEYGRAGYAQLRPEVAEEITAGTADESEMGVYHDLHQHQRVANIRRRLDEYLRFGLEAGIVFASEGAQ